jgi:MFS family permease
MSAPPPKDGDGLFNLPRNVKLLGWTSFFTDAGSEMILPILPLFLKGVLGAPMVAIGVVEGVAEATANLMRLGSGFWSDRIGKAKPFVYLGYGLSAVVKPLLALAPSWHFVLGVRFADRVGKGLRSAPRDALVAASTPKERFGKAFGFHRAMDTGGALVGSAIASAALLLLGSVSSIGIRWLFAASAIPCFIAIAFIGPVSESADAMAESKGKAKQAVGAFSFSPAVWLLLAGITLWELGNISYAFVLLRVADVGVPVKYVPLVYMGFNVVYMVVAMPLGMATDRAGIRGALLLAPLLGSAAFLTLGSGMPVVAVAAGMILYALHTAAINTVPRVAVAHFGAPGARGTLFGLVGACSLIGNTFAGFLWQKLDSAAAMQVAGIMPLLSLGPFSLLMFRKPEKSGPDVGR